MPTRRPRFARGGSRTSATSRRPSRAWKTSSGRWSAILSSVGSEADQAAANRVQVGHRRGAFPSPRRNPKLSPLDRLNTFAVSSPPARRDWPPRLRGQTTIAGVACTGSPACTPPALAVPSIRSHPPPQKRAHRWNDRFLNASRPMQSNRLPTSRTSSGRSSGANPSPSAPRRPLPHRCSRPPPRRAPPPRSNSITIKPSRRRLPTEGAG